ncbi:MAG: methyltransferase [Proteobacteria bacterium]|nr:methyltransferase [Pseudomonadota bacterium]
MNADKFIGGRVVVRQMGSGFRSGLDAVMLAASIPAKAGEEVLELGAGAGAASLCLARRVSCSVFGIEIDPGLAALADENAAENDLSEHVHFIAGDVLDMPAELRRSFEHVMCNPPFHDEDGQTSPDAGRALALQDRGSLTDWLTGGMKRVVSNGTFTAILRADRMNEALTALGGRGATVFPLWPRAGEAAKRILVRVVKGSRAPFTLLPGLVLHEAGSNYTRAANAILRDGRALEFQRA